MWFMNKIANPFVRLILRSPLHGLFSATLLLITYRGRKSGKEYTLPVQYVRSGKTIYIVPGMPEQKTWWRNLKGGLPVKISLRGQILNGEGRLLDSQNDSTEAATGFGLYLQCFPSLVKYHNVLIEADGAFNTDDLCKASSKTVIVRVDLK
jgi:deazaflavin-dependent oxidoreductase (nitroreductase family)